MLIKGSDIVGLKVITIQRGKQVENVDDVIYDPKVQKVRALLVDPGGWFSNAKVILFEDIKSIGRDAVMIESSNMLKKASDVGERISRIAKEDTYLTQEKIFTEDGIELGRVNDIFFDAATGKVEEFEVTQGSLKDISSGKKRVKANDVVTVGEDAIIIKGYTEKKIEEKERAEGIKSAITKGQNRTVNDLEDLTRKVEQNIDYASSQIKDAISESKNMPQEEAQKKIAEVQAKSSSIIDDASKQIEEFSKGMRNKVQKFRNDPYTKQTISDLKHKIAEANKSLVSAIDDILYRTRAQIRETQVSFMENRKKDAVGKYLTKNILLPTDKILAKRGDMVTYKLIQDAEKEGLLDQVLSNNSSEPVIKR